LAWDLELLELTDFSTIAMPAIFVPTGINEEVLPSIGIGFSSFWKGFFIFGT
jgi:hypothetical protein